MRQERLARVIHFYQEALLAHPETQETHEATLSLLQGGRCGRDHPGSTRVRLLRYQVLRVAETPAAAQLYRQAAAAIQRLQREEP